MAYEKAFFHKDLGEFITCRVVLAWPNVLTARRVKGDTTSPPRFTVTGLIHKGQDFAIMLDEFNRAGKAEHSAVWGSGLTLTPTGFTSGVKKKTFNLAFNSTADDPVLGEFASEYPWFIKAAAKAEYKPLIYGPSIKLWEGEDSEIYSGRRALLGGKLYAYKTGMGGASFGLNRVILLEHGERLPLAGGGPRPISADHSGFEAVDIGEGESASDMFA